MIAPKPKPNKQNAAKKKIIQFFKTLKELVGQSHSNTKREIIHVTMVVVGGERHLKGSGVFGGWRWVHW